MTDARVPLFQGEVRMLRWADSSTNGASVTFEIHHEDLDQFKHLKAGKKVGMRMACVLVEIQDDESANLPEPVPRLPPAPRGAYPRPVVGQRAMTAVAYCKNPTFRQWVSEQAGAERIGEEEAKHFILEQCHVIDDYGDQASRKHLDTDPQAAELFEERIRRPYVHWLAEQDGFT